MQLYLPIADLPVNVFLVLAMGAAVGFVSGMAWFSSDRTIREYAQEIWNVPVNPITPPFQDAEDQRGATA